MHKFIYSNKDTYINNSTSYKDKNFGIDEILEVYASNRGTKTVYADSNWHPVPPTSSSYGNEGWLAYDTSSLYIYSGSKWRQFSLTSDTISGQSFIANFTGRLSNVTSSGAYLLVSGSSDYASGSFSGSMSIIADSYMSGTWTTGSFSGSVQSGSSFTYLILNNSTYTSPLTASISGTGSFKGLSGVLLGKSNTGIPCSSSWYLPVGHFDSGSFNGTFTGSNWSGYVQTVTSSNLYYVDVNDYVGYFVGKYIGAVAQPSTAGYLLNPEFSRIFLNFDITELSQSIAANQISSSNMKFYLDLTACGARNLPMNYTLYAYPLSQSWDNGDGRYANDGSNLGASWNYRNRYSGSSWYGEVTRSYQQVDYILSQSYASASWQNGGGTWYYSVPSTYTDKTPWICSSSYFGTLENSGLICSQSFDYGEQSDVNMDITQIVRAWLCGCVPNNGIVLLTSLELSTPPLNNTNGLLQFFSKETNTIYSPKLDVKWADSIYNTGSLAPVTGSTDNLVALQYLKEEYKAGSKPKVYVFARDKYPLKQFNKSTQQPALTTPKYLPTSSYYMLKDAESMEIIVPFDAYSQLSCESTKGNYFILDTTNLPQERYYKIFIKVEYSDGTIDIQSSNKIFKITR